MPLASTLSILVELYCIPGMLLSKPEHSDHHYFINRSKFLCVIAVITLNRISHVAYEPENDALARVHCCRKPDFEASTVRLRSHLLYIRLCYVFSAPCYKSGTRHVLHFGQAEQFVEKMRDLWLVAEEISISLALALPSRW